MSRCLFWTCLSRRCIFEPISICPRDFVREWKQTFSW